MMACDLDIEHIGELSFTTLFEIERMTSFDQHLIYALLHEAIYCQGCV